MADTARLSLPLLSAAQAQKEVTHNEALARADIAIQAVVVAVAPSTLPSSPAPGECWIVGDGATGDWAGQDGAIACWTGGGWRFIAPFDGMAVWSLADGMAARRVESAWATGVVTANAIIVGGDQVIGQRQPAIVGPASGTVVDIEARSAISAVLDALRTHGLIEI